MNQRYAGRRRRAATRSLTAIVGLAAALVVGAVLLALPTPEPDRPARPSAGPLRLADAWPKAGTGAYAAELPDGAAYTPMVFLDTKTSVGAAPDPDGESERLLLVTKGRQPRLLHTLPADVQPGFNGVVSDGKRVVWAETAPGSGGAGDTTLWIADVSGGQARTLTEDTGEVVFFGSQHDLQIVKDRLYWASQVRSGRDRVTEVRSVPLAGGEVAVQRFEGAYALAGWPWLVSIPGSKSKPVTLRRATGGGTVTARPAAGEMLTCGTAWCRVLVLGDEGVTRLDVMRPDGSQRRRVAGRNATPAVLDIMLLDRFEPLTAAARPGSATDQRLLLYDAKSGRTVLLADAMETVQGRDGFLWWSTGQAETKRWRVLDLRSLK